MMDCVNRRGDFLAAKCVHAITLRAFHKPKDSRPRHATSSDNRIEGNNVTDNDRGIQVGLNGNIIIRNTAAANTTNYDIVSRNVFGAIVDRTASVAPAVLGNSAASSAGTTDPWANFSY